MNAPAVRQTIPVSHVVKGQILTATEVEYGAGDRAFATPRLDIDALVWSRAVPPPAVDVPSSEIMDVLEAVGDRLTRDPDGALAEALEHSVATNPLPRDLLERSYAGLGSMFNRPAMEFQIEQELGGPDVIDGWREVTTPSGAIARVRAYPPRLIHVIAGNAPGVAAQSVIRGALTKGVHLIKLPSNDLFTATAILRAMSVVAPDHPLTRSFSAAYWRGGDDAIESALFRPQFFDKLIAWGGESTIRNALKHVGPGFELVSFDPKSSISMIGREAFESDEILADVVERAATDATIMNQQACASSRFQFIEGSLEQVDRYCAALQLALGAERPTASRTGPKVDDTIRSEIEGLRGLDPFYAVWGECDGRGTVVRSEEPVDFHPDGKVVNVVAVDRLDDAVSYVNVATQTVGIFPPSRKEELRDAIAAQGAQRVTTLGRVVPVQIGLPHDGFYPLHRFVRWVTDEG